jgi:predicted RNase H-like HicB family nuclease
MVPGISAATRTGIRYYGVEMPLKIKIIVERHEAGYVAYPLGLRDGVSIVGEGDTYDEALADVTSAIRFTLENAAEEPIFSDDAPVLEAFIAEAEVAVGAPVSR